MNRFNSNLNLDVNHLKHKEFLCGFFKTFPEMIGLAMFLINEKGQREIGIVLELDIGGMDMEQKQQVEF